MSMAGTARFTWTDTVNKLHSLNVPLQKVRPAVRLRRWVRESINFANREAWYAGDGVYEVVAEIRYDDAPASLVELMLAGFKNIVVTYYDGFNSYDCYMVGPVGDDFVAGFDEYQVAEDWHRVEIRLRKTDGTQFDTSIFSGNMLFKLDAAYELAPLYTFTRTGTVGPYTDQDGVLQSAAADVLRRTWTWESGGAPLPDTPWFMLEGPAFTNLNDEDDLTAWTQVNSPTTTGGQTDLAGGTGAYTVEDDSAAAVEGITHAVSGFTDGAANAIVFVVRENTMASSGNQKLSLTDDTAGPDRLSLRISSWSGGEPQVTANVGTFLGQFYVGNGYWALVGQTTTALVEANTNLLTILPAESLSATGSIDIYRVFAFSTPFAPWSVLNASAVKNAETLYFPFSPTPQTMCGMVEFRELQVPTWSTEGSISRRILQIGNAANGGVALILYRASGTDRYNISSRIDATTEVTSFVDLNPAWGDRVQLMWWLFSNGSVAIAGRTKALGATAWSGVTTGTTSGAQAFQPEWGDERLYLGSVGTIGRAGQLYRKAAIFAGYRTPTYLMGG